MFTAGIRQAMSMLAAAATATEAEPESGNTMGKMAQSAMSSQYVQPIVKYVTENGLNIIWAIAIFVLGRMVARYVAQVMAKLLEKGKVDITLQKFLSNLSYLALMTLVMIATITKLGVPGASLVAVVGAAGLAVGLALQGSLSNFAAGVLLIFFKPIKVGDYVEVGGTNGTVAEIQIFNTILNSPDNVSKVVSNSQVMGGTIINYSTNPTRRVDLTVGVSYKDNLQKTREVIQSVLAADSRVLADPKPVIAVMELGESSVNFVVRPWVKNTDYWPAYFDLTEKIKVALDQNGITIPFPQRDIHLYQEKC